MSDSRVEVLPVPEGSIIWLHNIVDETSIEEIDRLLRDSIPHNQFCALVTKGDGVVEVLGPDELVARVRAALDAS